jgi:hypothetical protein
MSLLLVLGMSGERRGVGECRLLMRFQERSDMYFLTLVQGLKEFRSAGQAGLLANQTGGLRSHRHLSFWR